MAEQDKHRIGSKVRINNKAPKYIRDMFPHKRTRTVVDSFFDVSQQHTLYQIGGRGKDTFFYWFRAEMLTPVTKKMSKTRGKPKRRRGQAR